VTALVTAGVNEASVEVEILEDTSERARYGRQLVGTRRAWHNRVGSMCAAIGSRRTSE
jgi:hypothetical protein